MKTFTDWMEKHFVPIAAKIGSQKHLVAIRDAFIAIMPITMAGAVAVLLNALLRDLPAEYGWTFISSSFKWLVGINGYVWFGTLAILSLAFAVSFGYQLAKAYNTNPVAGALVSLSAFVIVMPQGATFDATINGITEAVSGWGYIGVGYVNTGGLFTALIVGAIATIIYSKLMNANITIKLPDEVPPAVSRAFAAIIPGLAGLYAVAAIAWGIGELSASGVIQQASLPDLIMHYVQAPFMKLSQNVFSIILITFFVSLFWFFGLHGPNVLAPALDGIYKPALAANTDFYQLHKTVTGMPHIWTRGSFDAYSWMGGSGSTLALIIAILILSKRADSRAVAKYSLPMGLFNINEPVIFGLPIVLNPVYFIPFTLIPVLQVTLAYYVTKFGLVPPVYLEVPWVMPPVLYAFFATGFSISAALLALVNIAIAVAIWGVFVVVADRMEANKTTA